MLDSATTIGLLVLLLAYTGVAVYLLARCYFGMIRKGQTPLISYLMVCCCACLGAVPAITFQSWSLAPIGLLLTPWLVMKLVPSHARRAGGTRSSLCCIQR